MITSSDLLNFNVYKKEVHTGSDRGMRYRLGLEVKQEEVTDENGEQTTQEKKILAVYIWPEPYAFEKTDDAYKEKKEFEFSKEGQMEALAWLNQVREERDEYWESKRGIRI